MRKEVREARAHAIMRVRQATRLGRQEWGQWMQWTRRGRECTVGSKDHVPQAEWWLGITRRSARVRGLRPGTWPGIALTAFASGL